jgi:hypothetical protein
MSAVVQVPVTPDIAATLTAIQTQINTLRAGANTNIRLLYDKSDEVSIIGTAGPTPPQNTISVIAITDNDVKQSGLTDFLTRVTPLDAAQQVITQEVKTRFGYWLCLCQNFGYFPGGTYTPWVKFQGSLTQTCLMGIRTEFALPLITPPTTPYNALLISGEIDCDPGVNLEIVPFSHATGTGPGYTFRQIIPHFRALTGGLTFPGTVHFWTIHPSIDGIDFKALITQPGPGDIDYSVRISSVGYW